MRFVSDADCRAFFERLGFDQNGPLAGGRSAARCKTFDIHYRSQLATARQVGANLARLLGNFTICQLWVHDLVWGDRSREASPPADWAKYRRWRESLGEMRPLREAPGHVLEEPDREMLPHLIEHAINMGWDALIGSRPGEAVVQLSHDDRITVFDRTRPAELFESLAKLGLQARQRDRS